MTNQAQPGRPPVHDLAAFDLSKRSPEQIALSFARWKAQRKRQADAPRADPRQSPEPAGSGDAAPAEIKRASVKRMSVPRYSVPFSDLLAAGSEPAVRRTAWTPVAALRAPRRTTSPGRRLKVMSMLAGAASGFALAGGALLELGDWRAPAEVASQATQVRPQESPAVGSLAAAASSAPKTEWTLRRTVDVALMKAPASPALEPSAPAIQTASRAVSVSTGAKPALPERKSTVPEAPQFVAKPFVPNVAPAPIPAAQEAAPIPAPPVAAAVRASDPRPDALFQHGRDDRNGVGNRIASGGKPAAATGTASAVDARSASARKGTAASGGSVDPRGEGSGGARVGLDGTAGTPSDASGDVSGGKSGTGDAGDAPGDDGANGGDSDAGAGDGGDTAGGSAEDSGTGDTGTGGGDTGGDESGDASEGGSGDEAESGSISGAIGGALDAVGDALGGGKGNPDSNDKDQRN